MRFNPRAWIVWVVVMAVLAMFARNPLYSIILLVISLMAIQLFGRSESPIRGVFFQIAFFILLFSAIYHALFIHIGDNVLIELPSLPLVGGVITVEAIADGLRNGLVLVTLIAVFMALNSIVPSRELVRLVPAAFQDLGVVVLIAITYIPETRRHLRRIREAQAIRGHRPRGIRDWRPLIIPLLVGGLERAMNLSEAMVARGHVSQPTEKSRISDSLLLITGLSLAFIGWIVAVLWGILGYLILALGGLLLLALIIRGGRKIRRTRFTAAAWSHPDSMLLLFSLAALILVYVPWPGLCKLSLSYISYPVLQMPEFHPLMGIAFLLLSFPILLGITFRPKIGVGDKTDETTAAVGEGIGQAR